LVYKTAARALDGGPSVSSGEIVIPQNTRE
jgi:hypothetical protein